MLVLIAEVNGWRPQITSQILKSEVAAVLADMGVSGGTAGSGRREREMTVGRLFTAANEVTIGGFWREHAKGELKTGSDYKILRFLSPC